MRLTRIAFLILGVVGMGISSYLSFNYWLGQEPACLGGIGCGHIINTTYSRIWEIPLPYFGLAMYTTLSGLSLLVLKQGRNRKPFIALTVYALALSGTIYSACLTYLQFVVIQAFCTWCLASALVITFMFLLSLRELFDQSNLQ